MTVLTAAFYLFALSSPAWLCLGTLGTIPAIIAIYLWGAFISFFGAQEVTEYIDDTVDVRYCEKCAEPLLVRIQTVDMTTGLPAKVSFFCPHSIHSNEHTHDFEVDIPEKLKREESLEVTQPMDVTDESVE